MQYYHFYLSKKFIVTARLAQYEQGSDEVLITGAELSADELSDFILTLQDTVDATLTQLSHNANQIGANRKELN